MYPLKYSKTLLKTHPVYVVTGKVSIIYWQTLSDREGYFLAFSVCRLIWKSLFFVNPLLR